MIFFKLVIMIFFKLASNFINSDLRVCFFVLFCCFLCLFLKMAGWPWSFHETDYEISL